MGDTDAETTDEQPVERAVKFVGRDTIEGLAFPYTTDFDGERFTKSTDLCLDWFPSTRPLLYHHGLDSSHKSVKVGDVPPEFEERESGRWAQAQLAAHAKYRKRIDELIEQGALGFSSGAYGHLATKNRQGAITRWPWVEESLTPIPAHPGTLGVHYVKAADMEDLFDDLPPAVQAAIKALDEWADTREPEAPTDPSAFDAKAGRVSAAVVEFRDHARNSFEMRAKTGRVLSAANRDRISTALASREAVLAAYADLEALLSETDPETKSADLSFLQNVAETLRRADDVLVRL